MAAVKSTISRASHLECSSCGKHYSMHQLQGFANCCNQPLVCRYHFKEPFDKLLLKGRRWDMWRYEEMLPVFDPTNIVSLGEGTTPLFPIGRLAEKYGYSDLIIKDEGLNPTASFKSRGISVAVSKAKELGVTECIIPTAGNAGGALSAYCAAAGIRATVVMPVRTPMIFQDECRLFGAEVILVDGLIDKCGQEVARIKKQRDVFDVSTLKEPYRLEGKKTMGYEIAEQLDWYLPDVIVYPTGGGTGLIGIWKAFREMVELGWIENHLPKMVAVQSSNCDPVVQAFQGDPGQTAGQYRGSIANGLAVPHAFGKDMIAKVLRESNGFAVSVEENKIMDGIREISQMEGITISPEGAVVWLGLQKLVEAGKVSKEEKILLLNTGSGYKYFENYR